MRVLLAAHRAPGEPGAGEAATRYLGDDLGADFLTTEAADETIMPSPRTERGRLVGAGPAAPTRPGIEQLGRRAVPLRLRQRDARLGPAPAVHAAVGLYQIHLSGAGYDVAGSGYPGTPGIWFGHNDRAAWGITNLVASPRDLYVETLDGDRYRDGDGWAPSRPAPRRSPCGAPDETITIRSTSRGLLVDEIVPLAPEPGPVASRPPSASAGPARTSSTTPRPSST